MSGEFDGFSVAAGFDRKPQIFDGREFDEFKRFWPIAGCQETQTRKISYVLNLPIGMPAEDSSRCVEETI